MPTPEQRFIGSYSNHRFNPFTAADMAADKTEDHLTVPTSSPFCLQLVEVPRKDSPSSLTIYNYSDGIWMTEVLTAPTLGQFRVDYPSPDGYGTGLVEFNSGDAGKDIKVIYKATGSPIVGEILDGLVPWPSPSPGENQGVIFKSGAPSWAYFPKRYFHEGNVLYHAGGEDESSALFRFKKGANDSKVYLELKGAKLHQGWYTELKQHNHGGASGANGGHSHSGMEHSHGAGSLGGSQPTHQHQIANASGGGDNLQTEGGGDDAVSISGTTASSGSLSTGSESDHTHPVSNDGGSPKTYPDQLKVFIDGVEKTANILALSGLEKLGDGSSSHGFVTAGTGEIDITSLLGGGTMHEIKITEPISDKGGRVLLSLEVY